MKILVVDLLRLGDCLMTVPVLNGLKAARRDSEIHMLTFKPCASLHAMLPAVSKWWTLDRDELQAGLGEADIPMLTSFSVLKEQLDHINGEKFDMIVNLSQTNFSAWIAGYLKANDRLGLTFDAKGLPHFYSPWFRYLNDQPENAEDIFHYTDIFAHACRVEGRSYAMRTTKAGDAEVKALKLNSHPVAVFQLFTSDVKKDWEKAGWLALGKKLAAAEPDLQFVALGAPNEETRVDEFIAEAKVLGVHVTKAIVSLEGALSLLHRADLLITGDTSIKHLANATGVKVIELCIGWSDWRRTGVYKADSLILKARQGGISANLVFEAACAMLRSEWTRIAEIAKRAEGMQILRTRILDMGFWFAEDLCRGEDRVIMQTLIERSAWKLSLSRERRRETMEFGSAGMSLRRDLKQIFSGLEDGSALAHLDFLDKSETEASSEAAARLRELRREMPVRDGDFVEIANHRKQQIGLETDYEHSEYKTKLIRILKSHWTEMI
jgi:ADP-heptose:LPS heptosyltransferase